MLSLAKSSKSAISSTASRGACASVEGFFCFAAGGVCPSCSEMGSGGYCEKSITVRDKEQFRSCVSSVVILVTTSLAGLLWRCGAPSQALINV
jgi:hypothetical protein